MKTEDNMRKKIQKIVSNYKKDLQTPSIYRCSNKSVEDFISKEASAYSYKTIGTIHNSIAKKTVDIDLKTEKEEIKEGIQALRDKYLSPSLKYPSNISLKKLQELLTTLMPNWVFQTSNSHRLVSFSAKSFDFKIKIFINFNFDGDYSYICFGDNCGYISSKILNPLKNKLTEVYEIISKGINKNAEKSSYTFLNRIEKLMMEDPDSWNIIKTVALNTFLQNEKSFFEKIFKYFNFCSDDQINLYRLLQEETSFSQEKGLSDVEVGSFLLDSILIDIKQVYP